MAAINFTILVDKILSGEKKQTIRRERKRPIKPGDALQLYQGLRTKNCKLIGVAVCTQIQKIKIDRFKVTVNETSLTLNEMDELAKKDGFTCYGNLLNFFSYLHGLPFEGVIIHWDNLTQEAV